MASLTDTSIIARKIIRYGIYAVILILIGRFFFRGAITLYRRLFPPPPPAPTVEFGKLPPLPFPDKDNPQLTYRLETIDGQLPNLPNQTRVYFMPPATTSINAFDDAKLKAQRMGYSPEGKLVVESVPNVYVFEKTRDQSQLTMNIITGVFSVSYNIDADPNAVGGLAPNTTQATSVGNALLSGAGILTKDLVEGRQTFEFLKIESSRFVKAISQSDATLTKVNFYRKEYVEGVSSVTPNFPAESNVWLIVSTARSGGNKVIAAEYHYYPIDEERSATYPLITAQEAWDALTQDKAYIANQGNNQGEVVIRNVYLAHYDAGQYTEFYQPVIVFEGDNNFTAFVPAVTGEFYGGETTGQ
jgi:hypothetical protein